MKKQHKTEKSWLRALARASKYAQILGRAKGNRSTIFQLPRSDHDVETSEDCWERAGPRIRQMDPERKRARAIPRELVVKGSKTK